MAGWDPALWRSLSPLFDQALDLDGAARAAFVETLRRSSPAVADVLDDLLQQHGQLLISPFLESPPLEGRSASLAGQVIGGYTLDRPLGTGGMGTVWLARRSDGRFEGLAAVKLLNLALVDRGGQQRFEREATLLARLSHPLIARLLDAGVTAGGQPYLVLEYVEGVRLDRHADDARLDVQARLGLFLQVADAVAHAHANLVVHRDLKPSNILVDRDGCVKLLDFGVGTLVADHGDGASAARTWTSAGAGFTPEFAAPEQVQDGDVTTATDVYALGVVLYQLLVGAHPTAEPGAPHAHVIRALTENEPRPMSDVARELSSAAASGLPVLAARATTSERLRQACRGDLDTIAGKALRKRAPERYQTVAALSADIRAHLHHQPVSARPDSLWYRTRKLVARRRLEVATAAIVLLALLVGTGVALRQATRASREAMRAETAKSFLTSVFTLADPTEARGRTVSAQELLDAGAQRVDTELASDPALQAELKMLFGRIYTELGLNGQAERQLRGSLEVFRGAASPSSEVVADAERLLSSALLGLGRLPDASTQARAAVDRLTAAGAVDGDGMANALMARANVEAAEANFDQARATLDRVLEIRSADDGRESAPVIDVLYARASLLANQGRPVDAERAYAEVLAARRALYGADHPDVVRAQQNHATQIYEAGRYVEAEQAFRATLDAAKRLFAPEHPVVTKVQESLATTLAIQSKHAEGKPLLVEALANMRKRLGARHPDTIQTLNTLADVELVTTGAVSAEAHLREALSISEEVYGESHPEVAKQLHDLAMLLSRSKSHEAEVLLDRALAILRARLGPSHAYVGRVFRGLGLVRFHRGDLGRAEEAYRRALEILRVELPPGHTIAAETEHWLGQVLLARGRAAEAVPLLESAKASYAKSLASRDSRTAALLVDLGRALVATDRLEDARAALTSGRDMVVGLRGPGDPEAVRAARLLRSLGR